MRIRCTAIVLVHRETPLVWQCLASLVAFEHLRVINTSTNLDAQKLRAAGATDIVSLPGPITDFAKIRNRAMHEIKTPWCFFIDSDEIFETQTPGALNELQQLCAEPANSALSIKRSDVFLERKLQYGEAGNQALIRFMRPDQARWEGAAHEIPVVTGFVRSSDVTLSHYSHESINSFIEDVSKYAKIVATQKQLSRTSNLVQLICFPPLKLAYDLLLLGALLDGWRGVVYSYCMALHSLLVRIYWYEKHAGLVSQSNTTASN